MSVTLSIAGPATRVIDLMSQTPPVDAVLFDLDGTLLHTAPDIARALNRTLSDEGLRPLSLGEVQTIIGWGTHSLVEWALTLLDSPLDNDTCHVLRERFERYYQEESGRQSELFPGIEHGLHILRSMGVKMGVVTNKDLRFVNPLLHRFRLSRFFDIVVSGDMLPSRKPHPAPLLYACDALGVAPEQTLFVGDSHNDMQAATAAGVRMAWVSYGYNEARPVAGSGYEFRLNDIGELHKLICIPRF